MKTKIMKRLAKYIRDDYTGISVNRALTDCEAIFSDCIRQLKMSKEAPPIGAVDAIDEMSDEQLANTLEPQEGFATIPWWLILGVIMLTIKRILKKGKL